MAIGLALLAAFVYGAADFSGGLASRKTAPVAVVVISQLAGFVVLGIAWIALPGRFYWSDVGFGVAAGIGGAIGVAALYAALAAGRMGIVSPITAVIGASVPVVVGLTLHETPSRLALVGVALAFVAVALVSADAETRRISLHEPGVRLALISGIGIGALYVFLAKGHSDAGIALLVTTRLTSVVLLATFAYVRGQSLRAAPRTLATILCAGTLDMIANILYFCAARYGLLSIVAVLTSLYPASTVFLARILLGERLLPTQWVGVVIAIVGVALIAL